RGAFRARNPACPAHGALAARLPDRISLSAQRPRGRRRSGQHARQKAAGSAQPRGARGAGRPFGNDEDLSYVDADNVGGARMAVQYLLSHGRGTVATVAGPPDMSPGVDRLRGYRLTMAEAGLSDSGLIVFGDFGRVSAEHAVYRLLDRRPGLN